MEKRLIACGLLSGVVGAAIAFAFARVFCEPVIARAIDFEDGRIEASHTQGHQHQHGVELFSRGVQENAGLGFGLLLFGAAMGALLAVVFCVAYGRRESAAPQTLSIRLAAATFVTVYLVPFVKYPPNPPAVGQANTIGTRTLSYLVVVAASVLLACLALWLARRLSPRQGAFNAYLLSAGAYTAGIAAIMLILPDAGETPQPMRDDVGAIVYPGFPADVLYEFRLVSLGTQLVLWVTIGLVFAVLARRLLDPHTQPERDSRAQ